MQRNIRRPNCVKYLPVFCVLLSTGSLMKPGISQRQYLGGIFLQTHSKLINWYANILMLQSFQVTVFELAVLQASISRLQLLKTSLVWLLVSSRPPQGDMRVFAKCKDNHWAINEGQKGTISGVSTRANCRRCEAARALGRRTRRQTQKLVFKLPHANARS